MSVATMMAVTDQQTYDPVGDIKIACQWTLDRVHTPETFSKMDVCNTRARTATLFNGIVYVAHSEAKTIVVAPGDTVVAAVIYRFDAKTGEQLPDLDVTFEGRPFGTFLGVNQIGVDNFGHMWVMPYTSEQAATVKLYQLDPESGELTLVQELEKGDDIKRTDYYDLVGDLLREEMTCTVMAAGSTEGTTVYRWFADFEDDFVGGFKGQPFLTITDIYPETVGAWSYGPTVKLIMGLDPEDEEDYYAGDAFYVDGFNSSPILYDKKGSLLSSFENVPIEMWPAEVGANGCLEFNLEDETYFAYSWAQYSGLDEKTGKNRACQVNIAKLSDVDDYILGENTEFCWQIPADGLGVTSDGGNRVHSIAVEYGTDDEGNEEVTLLSYKSYNGIAIYKIGRNVEGGDPGPEPEVLVGDVNGDGEIGIADVTALVSLILTTQQPTGDLLKRADVNQDGEVGIADLTALVAKLLEQQ